MAKKLNREVVTLACGECKERNYTTQKNKKNDPGRLEFKKYCPNCRVVRTHRETK
jgi:large subunit ribosomal protein L33